MSLTLDHIRWHRLKRSGLVAPFPSPEECARSLGGIQAQIHPAAALALWNRTQGMDHATFEKLLYGNRSLVKLWGQRGTLHIYSTEDWPLISGAREKQMTWWEKQIVSLGGDLKEYQAILERIAKQARTMRTIGRSDLREMCPDIDHRLLSPWGGIFFKLVTQGTLCHVRPEKGEGRFAHRENWLPHLHWNSPSSEEANTELARRYFHSYGPASIQDLAYWRGVRVSEARRWALRLGDELTEVRFGEKELLLPVDDAESLHAPPPPARKWPVHLLYRFDPLLLGHKDKSWLIDMRHYKQVWQQAGHIEGTVLARGRIVASWRYARKGRKLSVAVEPFKTLPKYVHLAVERKARKVARFFDLEPGMCEITK